MKLRKKTIIMLMMMLVLSTAGCSLSENSEKTPVSNKTEESFEVENTVESDNDNFVTYKNQDQFFSIEHPADWDVREGEDFGAFHASFVDGTGNAFAILPKGELDVGLPWDDPKIEKTVISNKKAEIKSWEMGNNKVLVIIVFMEFPSNWSNYNRIQFSGTDLNAFDKMLQSFTFID